MCREPSNSMVVPHMVSSYARRRRTRQRRDDDEEDSPSIDSDNGAPPLRSFSSSSLSSTSTTPPASPPRENDDNDETNDIVKQHGQDDNDKLMHHHPMDWQHIWRTYGRLPFCAAGICLSFLCHGLLEEVLFTKQSNHTGKEERLGASFVLVTSCLTNTLVALLWRYISSSSFSTSTCPASVETKASTQSTTNPPQKQQQPPLLPHKLFLLTALCFVSTMECSNEAIPHVSYPFVVLAKSCKLLPIMLVGTCLRQSRYSVREWTAALLLSAGIVLFHLSKQRQQPGEERNNSNHDRNNSLYGIGLLSLSLLLDGVLSSCQGMLKAPAASRPLRRIPTAVETMLYVNLYSLVWLLPLTVATGTWRAGIMQLMQSPHVAARLSCLNVASGSGQVFLFLTLSWYSPLVVTTITTTRKFVSIWLSVQTFGHALTGKQWASVVLVFGGLALLTTTASKSTATTKSTSRPVVQSNPSQTTSRRLKQA